MLDEYELWEVRDRTRFAAETGILMAEAAETLDTQYVLYPFVAALHFI